MPKNNFFQRTVIINLTSFVLATVTASLALGMLLNWVLFPSVSTTPGATTDLRALNARLDSLEMSLQIVHSDTMFGGTAVAVDERGLSARMGRLEAAIELDPVRALSVPLLRKDLDNLAASVDVQLSANQEAIRNWYDFNKWFVGLLATQSLAIIGLAISAFRSSRKQE